MTNYKVIKIPQEEFDKLDGLIFGYLDHDGIAYSTNVSPHSLIIPEHEVINKAMTFDIIKHVPNNWVDDYYIKFEPIKEGEFTLNMLESGKHGIEIKSGEQYLFAGEKFVNIDTWHGLEDFEFNLDHKTDRNWDIVRVFELANGEFDWDFSECKQIWKRPEKSERDSKIEELENRLKKLNEDYEIQKSEIREVSDLLNVLI